ncbi:hypothetical protein ACIBI9_39980 [Nonomuraea sp. NPDC050451]|uniref:hypothetical protein n=1 Tax=Nonomuraea sp. NPDC050451 TaxID=3364364 RepID=UPI0037A3525D
MRIRNSRTDVQVLLGGVILDKPGAVALRFTRNEVGSDVVCGGMSAYSEVRFVDSQITLDLAFEGRCLLIPVAPHSTRVGCRRADVHGAGAAVFRA